MFFQKRSDLSEFLCVKFHEFIRLLRNVNKHDNRIISHKLTQFKKIFKFLGDVTWQSNGWFFHQILFQKTSVSSLQLPIAIGFDPKFLSIMVNEGGRRCLFIGVTIFQTGVIILSIISNLNYCWEAQLGDATFNLILALFVPPTQTTAESNFVPITTQNGSLVEVAWKFSIFSFFFFPMFTLLKWETLTWKMWAIWEKQLMYV